MNKNYDKIQNIIDYIDANDDFIVSSHVNPDGDNIGSSLGVYYFLEKIGKKVSYVLNDDYPTTLMFLYDDKVKKKSSDIEERGQIVIALDAGDYSRICIDKEILEKAKEIVCIDHHVTNGDYSNIKYIDTKASSTCEMVYNLLKMYEKKKSINIIDEKIATALYTGLITDTGNFQYSNTSASSLYMAGDLMEIGADKNKVIQEIYQNNSLNFYKILGDALSTLEVYSDKISVITVTEDMLTNRGVIYDDIDPITPYSRDIEGVELGIFIKERTKGEVKVSFRSKNYVDCTVLAKKFGGGGHIRAAGCTIFNEDVETAKKMLLDESLKHL